MDDFILNLLEAAPQLGISVIAMYLMFKMYNLHSGIITGIIQENSRVMGEILEAMRHLNGKGQK